MLDARFSHLHFCQNLLQRGLPAIAGLLVIANNVIKAFADAFYERSNVNVSFTMQCVLIFSVMWAILSYC